MTYDELDLSGEKSVADKWILTRLNETIEDVTQLADRYEFGEVGRHLYNFIWDDVCDWYIVINAKREAFQILFAKFHVDSTFS